MIKDSIFYRVAMAVVAFYALLTASCEKPEEAVSPEVSAQYSEVSAGKGEMFVTVRCSGDWTLSLQAGGQEVDWARLSQTDGTGDKLGLRLSYDENLTGESRSLTIVIVCGEQWNSCQVVQLASAQKPDDAPDQGGNDQNDKPDVDLAKAGWMELPAMDDPDLEYYSHSFEMDGKTYRNYSFGYSKKDYLAIWVAYPLCEFYLNNNYKDSDWIDNPLVENDYEPNFSKSFGFSAGYERGHQIANADRKCCREANQQTYYYTNATLQHKSFNGPVWGVLEDNMREAAKSADTLYVVTGCVLDDFPEYITDYDGHKVPIPSGYFKAALRYHSKSTYAEWMGAAFYLDHDASKYPSQKITDAESMSISELEKKLGIDFFVNLPAKVGVEKARAIETQNPDNYLHVWGIVMNN